MKEYLIRTALTNKENAVILHIKKADKGCDFASADIYIRTSDKSGHFYTKYCLTYEKNSTSTTCKDKYGNVVPLTYYNGANGPYNRSNYRIKTASICKDTANGFEKVCDVLQQGELSLAFKEKIREDSALAGDFVGGYHGDENIKYENDKPMVRLALDGKEIDLCGREACEYVGNCVSFEQSTLINRCNTPEENIIEHCQTYFFDTDGVRVKQRVKFITVEYEEGGKYALEHSGCFMQMCTFWRLDAENNDRRICDDLKFFDENGNLVNEVNTSAYKKGDFAWVGEETETVNRAVEYNGDIGVYGLAGYKILDNSTLCHYSKIQVRTFGDNKWYCAFKSPTPARQPKKGEEWKLELLYYIDYNTER